MKLDKPTHYYQSLAPFLSTEIIGDISFLIKQPKVLSRYCDTQKTVHRALSLVKGKMYLFREIYYSGEG
jgi:hypothetical protein